MNIAIIGAGNVGSALASSATRAGHNVTLSSKDQDEADRVASETGASAAPDNPSAVEDAEVVILAVPYPALEDLAEELASDLDGKVVVDVSNRMNPDDPAEPIDGTSAAEQLQAKLGGTPVIKAFNTAFAARQENPDVNGTPADGFVAGDDPEAKPKVLELVGSMGFRPIDVGPLGMARALEAMGNLNIMLQIRNDGSWQSTWKLIGPLN